jgi:hypothetical protein
MTRIQPAALLLALSLVACTSSDDGQADPTEHLRAFVTGFEALPELEVARMRVQHILIGYRGSVPGKGVTRSVEEAETLAGELLIRIQNGEDFDALVKDFTNDAHPGIYAMVVKREPGESLQSDPPIFERHEMVPAFGNVGWRLEVGEVGVAPHDPSSSPYGWHIVKRVE